MDLLNLITGAGNFNKKRQVMVKHELPKTLVIGANYYNLNKVVIDDVRGTMLYYEIVLYDKNVAPIFVLFYRNGKVWPYLGFPRYIVFGEIRFEFFDDVYHSGVTQVTYRHDNVEKTFTQSEAWQYAELTEFESE